ncbi:uncharacterized protein LOC143765824 isoform X1 [Ranitomeya variabilis]|uniref:uncharacterized protein LOC143765824 isoform X1 n=1 Tax=Ranitomeya variabilis TaxID=490064 RepID=UPI00405698AF
MANKFKKSVSPQTYVLREERTGEQKKQKNQNHSRDQGPDAAKDLQRDRGAYSQNQVRPRPSSYSASLGNCFSGDNHEGDDYYQRDTTSTLTPNLDFYQNKKPFKPNGVHIDELLTNWRTDYDRLERNHSYIQWLFPLRKPGQNQSAKPLTTNEIQMMKKDSEVNKRFLEAYNLMLGFYGIKLLNSKTGQVTKADNWRERFENLNTHSHNNLRITRILKCLEEMGYNHLQIPLVQFFLHETLVGHHLPNVQSSALKHFMFTVKEEQAHRKLETFVQEKYKSKDRWASEEAKKFQKWETRTSKDKTSYRTPNLDFYQNKEPFKPNGVHIDVLLTRWRTDYDRLEKNRYYIQWLFPLRSQGINSSAIPLTEDEIQMMKQDREVMSRFRAAYKLMLGFYGIKLQDPDSGKVTKAENWRERFRNLNNHSHNNMRITRILKCLREMGYSHFQAPLVNFFLQETLWDGHLPNVKQSALDYFMPTVKDTQEHKKLNDFVQETCKPKERQASGEAKKEQIWRKHTPLALWKGSSRF